MSIAWDSLASLEDWAVALDSLLDAAAHSVRSGSPELRTAAQRDLIEFVMQSPNSIAIELDELARAAVDAVVGPASTEALAVIAAQKAALMDYLPPSAARALVTK